MLECDAALAARLAAYPDPNNNADKAYSLRPRSARRPPAAPKPRRPQPPKPRPAPLSKYRRKTANARERGRMREINQAFEALRRAVPQGAAPAVPASEKLTKITTLRLAMKYISALSSVLTDERSELLADCGELACFLLESDGESLPLHSDLSETSADFSVDFGDDSLSGEFSTLSSDFDDHLKHFDPFLAGFS